MGQVVQTQDGQTIIYQPVQQNTQATTTDQTTAAAQPQQQQQHIQLQTQGKLELSVVNKYNLSVIAHPMGQQRVNALGFVVSLC